MVQVNELQKLGIGLSLFGVTFLFLGMMLLFDKGLLAIGNILFLAGLPCIVGFMRTIRFFFQYHKLKGSSFFFSGIIIVLIGWPILGMVVEAYGFYSLFRGFFPVVISFLRRVPVLGTVLNLPGISAVANKLGGEEYRTMV